MAQKEALPVYMDPIELSQLMAVLTAVAPRRCLEWGSGGSTKAILERCPFVARYVSVEHHAEWFEKVRSIVVDERLLLHHAPADQPPSPTASKHDLRAWDALAEQDPALLATYVGFPRTLGEPFDFVLVDGRARRFCIKEGFELLRSGGVLVLHDAQRTEYHDALHAVGRPVFLEPWRSGQICVLRKD